MRYAPNPIGLLMLSGLNELLSQSPQIPPSFGVLNSETR